LAGFQLHRISYFHSFSVNLYLFLNVNLVSCRLRRVGLAFSIHSAILCLSIREFNSIYFQLECTNVLLLTDFWLLCIFFLSLAYSVAVSFYD
jgi:hypothetical protein